MSIRSHFSRTLVFLRTTVLRPATILLLGSLLAACSMSGSPRY